MALSYELGVIHLVDAATQRNSLATHEGTGLVRRIVFGADGRRVFSASVGGDAYVYDAATGSRVATLSSPYLRISAIALSQDGARLVAGDVFGNVRLIDVSPLNARIDVLAAQACRQFLSPHARVFTSAERAADPSLAVLWGEEDRDVCGAALG